MDLSCKKKLRLVWLRAALTQLHQSPSHGLPLLGFLKQGCSWPKPTPSLCPNSTDTIPAFFPVCHSFLLFFLSLDLKLLGITKYKDTSFTTKSTVINFVTSEKKILYLDLDFFPYVKYKQ